MSGSEIKYKNDKKKCEHSEFIKKRKVLSQILIINLPIHFY